MLLFNIVTNKKWQCTLQEFVILNTSKIVNKVDKVEAQPDRIRQELAALGVVLKDSPTGTTWERG